MLVLRIDSDRRLVQLDRIYRDGHLRTTICESDARTTEIHVFCGDHGYHTHKCVSPSAALNHPRRHVSVNTGTVGAGPDGNVTAGDTITSSFEVENTGHTCLTVMSIVDDNAGEVECPYMIDVAGEELWLVSFRTFDLACVGGTNLSISCVVLSFLV